MKPHHLSEPAADEGAKSSFLRSWESFWFQPADPTLLGFLRIVVGCVMLYVFSTYGIGLQRWVGPHAWVDQEVGTYLTKLMPLYAPPADWSATTQPPLLEKGYYLASVYFHVTDPGWMWVIHLSVLTAIFLFTIGYQTRITTVLAWMGAMCYWQRTPVTLFGMDTMNNILMIYFMISPCGAALSVDRWLLVRKLRRAGVKYIDPPAPLASARLALRLIQIHFCIIYLASGASKLQGTTWWDGTALWGCVANFTFAPMSQGWYIGLLKILSRNRLLWEIVMTGSAVYTLMLEVGLPFCIWHPKLRWLCILASVMLHTGIGLLMGLTTFSMLMLCMVITFTPPEYVRPFLMSLWRRRDSQQTQRVTTTVSKAPALALTR